MGNQRVDNAGYEFTWSKEKAGINEWKHGVSFEEATTVFGDPLAIDLPDPDHSLGEDRFVLLGLSARWRVLVVCYAD